MTDYLTLLLTQQQAKDLRIVLETARDSFDFDGNNMDDSIDFILTLLGDQLE